MSSRVRARPRRQWPFAKSTVRSCSTTVSLAHDDLAQLGQDRVARVLRSSSSFRSSFGTAASWSLLRVSPRGHSRIERRYAPRFHHVHKGWLRDGQGMSRACASIPNRWPYAVIHRIHRLIHNDQLSPSGSGRVGGCSARSNLRRAPVDPASHAPSHRASEVNDRSTFTRRSSSSSE